MVGVFYNIQNEVEELFEKLPQEIRKRNVLVGSYLIGVLLAGGYCDFEYLKDAFNICLFLDYKLCFEIWDKDEKKYLTHVYNLAKENKVNQQYVQECVLKYKEKITKSLKVDEYYLGTLKVLDFYCERLNGSGAPFGLDYNNLTDLELSVIFLLSGIDDVDIQDFERDASAYYKKIIDNKEGLLSKRIVEYLRQSFQRGDQKGFLKVAGL